MPAMTNILVKDDAATPKEWTFLPITDADGVPIWRTSDAAVALEGQPRLSASCVKVKSGDFKVTVKLEIPVMETLGASGTSAGYVAPQKVAHVLTGIFTTFVSKRSTKADRANLLRMLVGILQGASSTTATGTLANTAAGNAWAANAAPLTLLFTDLQVPS